MFSLCPVVSTAGLFLYLKIADCACRNHPGICLYYVRILPAILPTFVSFTQ